MVGVVGGDGVVVAVVVAAFVVGGYVAAVVVAVGVDAVVVAGVVCCSTLSLDHFSVTTSVHVPLFAVL